MTFRFRSLNLEATRTAARALAAEIDARADAFAIALVGELGAGKTAFVQGLGSGFGLCAEKITSPTFVIANEYRLAHEAKPIRANRFVHIDLYRVKNRSDVEAIGFWDFLAPNTVLAIEWSDRFPEVLPRDHLVISLAREAGFAEGARRQMEARASGPQSDLVLRHWRDKLCALSGIECASDQSG